MPNPVENRNLPESIKDENNVKSELKKLKLLIEWEKDAEKRGKLQRKLVRLERWENLENWAYSNNTSIQKDTQKIIWEKTIENIRNSDLLTLKKKWIDIGALVLTYENSTNQEVSSETMKAGDIFVVNFWDNQSLQYRMGAGDILPAEVKTVKINGVVCERKNTPRPGYYDEKGKYQVIYDWYKIELVTFWQATHDDALAIDRHWQNERLEDMMLNDDKPLTDIQDDSALASKIQEYRERAASMNKRFIKWIDKERAESFRLENASFLEIANNVGLDSAKIESVKRIMSAIGEHESNSNYLAVWQTLPSGSHKWTAAIGRYQIMPKNWVAWSNQYFGEVLEATAENQDKIAFAQMTKYYIKYSHQLGSDDEEAIFREIAGDWYWRWSAQIAWHPNTWWYQWSVLSIYRSMWTMNT